MGIVGKAGLLTENRSSPVRAEAAPKRCTLSVCIWPVLTFVVIFAGGLLVAANERAEFRADLREDTGLVREQLALRFERVISDMVRPMRRFGRDILNGNINSSARFQKSCESMQHEIPAYRKMWWLDASGVCVAASTDAENRSRIGHRLSEQPGWQSVGSAIDSRMDSCAMLGTGQDRPRLIVVIPVRQDGTGELVGFVVARLDVRDLLEGLIDQHTIDRFNVEVSDPSGNILLPARVNIPEPADFAVNEPIKALGATWHVTVWPLKAFIAHKPMQAEWMAIWGSAVLGLVAAWGVWQEGVHRRRHLAYQAALKALSDITAAIAAAPDASRQILGQVTQVAADLLEMPICVFSLWEESNERFEVIYSKGLPMNDIRGHYSFDELPATREAFRRGEPVCASDIRRNPQCFDQQSAEKRGIRSSIIVPLQLEDRPVGMLALSDKRPRKFSKSDLHLAKLWGQQAAVTVVNSELHRQTQRDAQAKVMLLRELNHRVKNNLASIAGLLCTSPVELPDDVRQWLDRVIERVSGMSRLHELLTDGMQSISVPDLVRKAVDSVMLLWPPDVGLSLDLNGEEASLTTDRAVTLAMVLHELMYNALRHGVSNNGMVWINSRVEENHVIVDVIDDASKTHGEHESIAAKENISTAVMDRPEVRVGGQTGLGLQLVRGLVARELQGQFTFSTLADGRTLARVVFHAIQQT